MRLLSCAAPAALLAAIALAACSAPRPEPLNVSTPADQVIEVALHDDFTMTLSASTAKAGRIKFNVTNQGTMSHGLGIEGLAVEQYVTPGLTLTQESILPARTYTIYCPVADHRDRGMRAQLVVQ